MHEHDHVFLLLDNPNLGPVVGKCMPEKVPLNSEECLHPCPEAFKPHSTSIVYVILDAGLTEEPFLFKHGYQKI